MAINGFVPVGDDQQWKAEVERIIKDLTDRLAIAEKQINSRGK